MTDPAMVYDARRRAWLRFGRLRRTVSASRMEDVVAAIARAECAVAAEGLWAAGFVSYEAAPAFDGALCAHTCGDLPLVWFGLYDAPTIAPAPADPDQTPTFAVGEWVSNVAPDEHKRGVERIRSWIAAGDTYQVNYTMRLRARFEGDARAFFARMARSQGECYGAYLDTGPHIVCSASPELFFELDGGRIRSRPMKGTAARGLTWGQDTAQAEWLRTSEKNRAENAMIVDMIRNDIGRVARVGSVRVEDLFRIEKYATVWQMTSAVTARTDASLAEVFAALFPCGSVTGAPKVRTMQIIRELEPDPRGVYTGAVGFIAPGRRAQFNVAIRTAVVDRAAAVAEYGVGGGIVWDSTPAEEYEECLAKAQVLTRHRPAFSLLETLLWTPQEGWFLLDEHVRRMRESALYFDFPFDESRVRAELTHRIQAAADMPRRVRLVLSPHGAVFCEALPWHVGPAARPFRLRFAPRPVDRKDVFLYHKTTHRDLYEEARRGCADADDVLLWNDRGEVTESSIANLAVRREGEWFTPPVSCGLLPGTFRAHLLARGEIRERVLTRSDVERAEKIALINSVRKWQPALLIGDGGDRRRDFTREGGCPQGGCV